MGLPRLITHAFYEQDIPSELDQTLVELYQNVFCVRPHFDACRSQGDQAVFVMYGEDAVPVHVLFFVISGGELTVLNELLGIEPECLEYFAGRVFEKYPKVHAIHLNRIASRIERMGYPSRIWNNSCDVIVPLPGSLEQYRAKLGKHTKSNMNNYSNKLRKEHSDFSFAVAAGEEADPALVKQIIEMNRARMDGKQIDSAIDAAVENRVQLLAKNFGLVATITVNGEIAAGTVCYQVGNHCYADIISHDSRYNKYSIGQVCIYLTIQALIERGVQAFHLLWGENDYKFRFLGVKHDIYFMSVYRARKYKCWSALTHISKFRYAIVAGNLCGQYARVAKGLLSGRRK